MKARLDGILGLKSFFIGERKSHHRKRTDVGDSAMES